MINGLTKPEKKWVLEQIRVLLESYHLYTGDKKKWNKQDSVLVKGITPECWTWDYDLKESELKILKGLWEKLKS
jgi:hypothetical protein